MSLTLPEKARAFAIGAHEAVGQVRKYTGDTYWTHPVSVAALLAREVPEASPEMLAAALLHDVVEDTGVSLAVVRAEFGDTVAMLVDGLTHRQIEGNRAFRMAHERDRLAGADDRVKTIKLADMIDNIDGIGERDPHFAKVYMREKRDLMPVLKGGAPVLWARAMAIIEAYYAPDA